MIEGSSIALACDACGWGVVTTNYNRPLSDEKAYAVFIDSLSVARGQAISGLSVELGLGVLKARRILDNALPVAEAVTATEVRRLHRLLSPRGMRIRTVPAFPWPFDDPLH